jgi:hypothetical protein
MDGANRPAKATEGAGSIIANTSHAEFDLTRDLIGNTLDASIGFIPDSKFAYTR